MPKPPSPIRLTTGPFRGGQLDPQPAGKGKADKAEVERREEAFRRPVVQRVGGLKAKRARIHGHGGIASAARRAGS